MRINKACVGADEFKFAAFKLPTAIVGEIFDERVLARHDPGEIKTGFLNADAPCLRLVDQVHDFSGIEQCFGGHAAAQNAQPADFFSAFEDKRLQTGARGGPRCREAGTAAADDRHVKIVMPGQFQAAKMSDAALPGQETKPFLVGKIFALRVGEWPTIIFS